MPVLQFLIAITSLLEPTVVQFFIGFEYQCSSGHRFIASGPDRVVMLTQTGFVNVCTDINSLPQLSCSQSTAAKVLHERMPLRMSCVGEKDGFDMV